MGFCKTFGVSSQGKGIQPGEAAEELRNANLPETRADELQTALRETIRNYQVAADTLATVISRESSPKAGPVPRLADDAQVDSLREKLGKLREQAQTVATQVRLDEEFSRANAPLCKPPENNSGARRRNMMARTRMRHEAGPQFR